ncbi:DUF2786 domain-containing protein [Pararhizobium sp. BT-229]|uniref:DUF2786 domain-containing protein n=1 Tax=Pararhizobium sp. BT-229 TaxID=2986923 RepID=UPI0021F79DE5|nr:DUF2786 domain-containing protein [Pararhizobium sp. BT-229]MCV9964434.1 DUF2786 domain-containing protein [Pararhizobium sp. BT-229]
MTDDKLSRIEKIKKRIRALLMKTVENGATEGEALAASEKAAVLMAEWDIESADLDQAASPDFRYGKVDIDPAMEDAIWRVVHAIGELCHCKVWISDLGKSISVFGDALDCEVAEYLMSICDRAVRQETRRADQEYALYRANIRTRKRLGFIDGISKRLASRVRELAWQRQRSAGTALVPAKMASIHEELRARGEEFVSGKVHQTIIDPEAWLEGAAKAETVSLNRGVSGKEPGRPIGRAPLAISGRR